MDDGLQIITEETSREDLLRHIAALERRLECDRVYVLDETLSRTPENPSGMREIWLGPEERVRVIRDGSDGMREVWLGPEERVRVIRDGSDGIGCRDLTIELLEERQALFDRINAAQARIETLQARTDPESPLGRLDRLMEAYDHIGTGDTADAAASIEEWAKTRADLAGVIRRPFGYAGSVFPLDACVWFRESTGEWVLEIAGAINDTSLICRHTQPGDLAPEEVPGLPALHGVEAAARAALGPVLDWYQPDEEQDRPLPDLIADAARDLAADRAELLALRRALAEIRDRTGEPEIRAAAEAALNLDRSDLESGPEPGPARIPDGAG